MVLNTCKTARHNEIQVLFNGVYHESEARRGSRESCRERLGRCECLSSNEDFSSRLNEQDQVGRSNPKRVTNSASSSINRQARRVNEKEKACQIAINVLPSSATEVRNQLAEDHRHARRSKRNKASLRDIEAEAHQPGWRFCGFFEKLRRGRLL